MKRSLVQLLLGLLICITPLQGVATMLFACCGPLSGGHPHAAQAAEDRQPHEHDESHASHAGQPCAACAACCSAPPALPVAVHLSLFQAETGLPGALYAPAGHIPDTPERPPRRRAA